LFSVFCFLRTITRSCNLWFLHLKKRIDDVWDSFESKTMKRND
jgi:hypothetical protein